MKDAHVKAGWMLAALLLLFAISVTTRADQQHAPRFLENLHQFRINSFIALESYYRYSASADQSIHFEIIAAINSASSAINALTLPDLDLTGNQSLADLRSNFEIFKELMRRNVDEVMQHGYPDLRLAAEMAEHTNILNATALELHSLALDKIGSAVHPRIEAARSAAVTMAQMMAIYSVRSNMAVTQTFQGDATDDPLDVKAHTFESYLAAVAAGDTSGAIGADMEDISSKWQFIRDSYIHYNENNVSFVIERYSRAIIEKLNNTISILQSNA
ncbi:hypothetical protein [Marinobacter sp. X15-166B]|uniref:hypothetical protein n=1 Tax=Marinobacter sp. X15-166B TaxID=1897620 RepID=UPI00085C57E6|nr:hypothetical protein [Marinobacter sp. X15-166B]OEY67390.1 hypothetical protein BG841_13720 [Marinobacter sp. X15-166B]